MWYMTEQQSTDTRQMASSEFRTAFSRLTEPVDVTVLGRVIGRYLPARPVTWEEIKAAKGIPTSRSAPEIPSGKNPAVGTAETDRAQSGTPDEAEAGQPIGTPRQAGIHGARVLAHGTSGADEHRPSAGPVSHEPGGVLHTAPLGSSPLSIIPPKPADYVHDPHFNAKGSRPAPKTRSGK